MNEEKGIARKTEAVCLGGGLSIYKQPKSPGRGSPYWHVRAKVDVGGRRIHTKSTKTTDQRLAEKLAHDFKADLLIEQRTGGSYVGGQLSDRRYRFDIVADALLDHLQRLAGHNIQKLRRLRDHRKIVEAPNGLAAFFKKADVRTITPEMIGEFISFAEETSRTGELKPTTKRNMLGTLRQILLFALDKRLIERVPRFPAIRMKDNPRPAFSEQEIRRMLVKAQSLAEAARGAGDECVLRPSEWAGLRHKHIEIVDGGSPHLRIAVVDGKTGERFAISMPGAVAAYRRLIARSGSEPEAFVFLPHRQNRETAKEKMRDRFQALLERAGLVSDAFGRKRVLYSLRHTALTLRVLNGEVDLLTLSRNAGTSVKMLEKFYCSGLDPAAKIDSLHSVKPRLRAGQRPPAWSPAFLAYAKEHANSDVSVEVRHTVRSTKAPRDVDDEEAVEEFAL
ncbi:tyrosine-type recombinase/integrase [Sphingomonas daechungensis]|uniref:tyrosine-type recombinase/integrase n=1 Tax=Sphingomonas daechungensis TaxID=1176646 RepID=UPI003784FA68